jgi:hypothetical protein
MYPLSAGDVVAGSRTKSSMSDGGRSRSSWRRIRRDVAPPDLIEGDPSWRLGAVAQNAFPKNLFVLSRCRIARTRVRRPALPIAGEHKRLGRRSDYDGSAVARRGKNLARIDSFWRWPIDCLYRVVQPDLVSRSRFKPLRSHIHNFKGKVTKN